TMSVSSHSLAWTTRVPATASNAIGWPPTVTVPVERVSLGWKKACAADPESALFAASARGGCLALTRLVGVTALAGEAIMAAAARRIGNFITAALAAPP